MFRDRKLGCSFKSRRIMMQVHPRGCCFSATVGNGIFREDDEKSKHFSIPKDCFPVNAESVPRRSSRREKAWDPKESGICPIGGICRFSVLLPSDRLPGITSESPIPVKMTGSRQGSRAAYENVIFAELLLGQAFEAKDNQFPQVSDGVRVWGLRYEANH